MPFFFLFLAALLVSSRFLIRCIFLCAHFFEHQTTQSPLISICYDTMSYFLKRHIMYYIECAFHSACLQFILELHNFFALCHSYFVYIVLRTYIIFSICIVYNFCSALFKNGHCSSTEMFCRKIHVACLFLVIQNRKKKKQQHVYIK